MGLLGYFSAVHASPPKAQVNAKINKAEKNLLMGNLLEMIMEMIVCGAPVARQGKTIAKSREGNQPVPSAARYPDCWGFYHASFPLTTFFLF
jgi:hypothetical protein